MNKIAKEFKYCKWVLRKNRTLTIEDRNDVHVYTFKVPMYVKLSQCIDYILKNLYNTIWKFLPYSQKWHYRLMPNIGLDYWWFKK